MRLFPVKEGPFLLIFFLLPFVVQCVALLLVARGTPSGIEYLPLPLLTIPFPLEARFFWGTSTVNAPFSPLNDKPANVLFLFVYSLGLSFNS